MNPDLRNGAERVPEKSPKVRVTAEEGFTGGCAIAPVQRTINRFTPKITHMLTGFIVCPLLMLVERFVSPL